MGVTVAELLIKARSDTAQAEQGIDRLNTGAQKTPGFLKSAAASGLGFIGAMAGMRAVGAGFSFAGDSIVGMNAELETSTLQFQTLMGDADRAEEHVRGLFDFAARTPFETGPIIAASKHLQVFGGDALNTEANLTLVGDAAAAMGVNMDEVAFWTGRAYNAIQAGKPFGESAMRLQEMGILTAEARSEMEEMQKAGASTSDVWQVMNDDLARNAGAMELQAGTWNGLVATFMDGAQMAIANAFQPLFESGKGALEGLIGIMSSGAFEAGLTSIVTGVANATTAVTTGLSSLVATFQRDGIGGLLNAALQAGAQLATAVGGWAAQIVPQLATLGSQFVSWLVNALPGLMGEMNNIRTTIVTAILNAVPVIAATLGGWVTSFLGWVGQLLPQLGTALNTITTSLVTWITGIVPTIAASVRAWVTALVDWVATQAIPGLLSALGGLIDGVVAWIGTGDNVARLTATLVQWTGSFLGWVATDLIPRVLQALPGVIASILGFLAQNTPKLVGALLTLGAQMIAGLVRGIMPALGNLLGQVGSWFGSLLANAGRWAAGVVSGIVRWFSEFPGKAMDTMKRLDPLLAGFLRSLPGRLWDAITGIGVGIVRGLWSGIQGLAGWLWSKISGWVGGMIDDVLGFLGISSPSKVFMGVGEQMVRGLGEGIRRNSGIAEGELMHSMSRLGSIAGVGQVSARFALAPAGALGSHGGYRSVGLDSGGTTIINVGGIHADRYVGTREEARHYAALIEADVRSLQSG